MKIELRNLSKIYRDADKELVIIKDLSTQLPSAGRLAIVGRSGIGKSTFLHLLAGLDLPSKGEILYDDLSLELLNEEERAIFRGSNMGFVFQSHHLLSEFSAIENVAMPLFIAGCSEESSIERARLALVSVGLADRINHRPATLSGGEQQRVAIARAVVTRPKILLADEPTGNLDPATASQISEILFNLQRDLNNLLVVVTHSMEFANSMDYLYEMQPGGDLERKK